MSSSSVDTYQATTLDPGAAQASRMAVLRGCGSVAGMPVCVRTIPSARAREVAEREHYMHRKPQVAHAYGLFVGHDLVGIAVYGTPASRHLQQSACPTAPSAVIELNRVWVDDEMPKNTESWFLSRTLKALPPRIVVSYADTLHGHYGYMYRALNFRYGGWTSMERRTPRYDYIPLDPTQHTREAFRSGYSERIRRRPKVRYWITTGDARERRRLSALCGWDDLDWKLLPPPGSEEGHRQVRDTSPYRRQK